MSADNGIVIRNHPKGGYALIHYSMSSDTYPEVSPTATQYASIEEAENAYDHMVLHGELITEYGLSILLDASTDPMTSEAYHKRMETAVSGVSSEKPTTADIPELTMFAEDEGRFASSSKLSVSPPSVVSEPHPRDFVIAGQAKSLEWPAIFALMTYWSKQWYLDIFEITSRDHRIHPDKGPMAEYRIQLRLSLDCDVAGFGRALHHITGSLRAIGFEGARVLKGDSPDVPGLDRYSKEL